MLQCEFCVNAFPIFLDLFKIVNSYLVMKVDTFGIPFHGNDGPPFKIQYFVLVMFLMSTGGSKS